MAIGTPSPTFIAIIGANAAGANELQVRSCADIVIAIVTLEAVKPCI